MKKIILISLAFLFLGLGLTPLVLVAAETPPPQVSPAQSGFIPLAPITGLTSVTDQNSAANSANLAVFFNNLYKFLIGLAAVLAVIEIIWGGLEISTKDSVSKQSDGKERITQAIFGLILVLSPVLVFSIINKDILKLSLNLAPLNLKFTPYSSGTETTLTGPTPAGATDIIQGNKKYTDRFYSCDTDGNCDKAKEKCSNDPQANFQLQGFMSIVCLQNGVIVQGKRTGYSYLPFTDYSCSSGETPSVRCIMKNN